jgi:hypothetical protein
MEEVNFWKLDSLMKELPGCFVIDLHDTSDRIDSKVNIEAQHASKAKTKQEVNLYTFICFQFGFLLCFVYLYCNELV